MNRLICLKILVLLLIPILPFAQRLLVDDYHSWESGAFSEFYDTLRSAGIEIYFTSDEGLSNIENMDCVWLQSPGGYSVEQPDTDFFEKIKNYYFNVGPLFISINFDDRGVRWINWLIDYIFEYKPFIVYHKGYDEYYTTDSFWAYPTGRFPPLTNECDSFLVYNSLSWIKIIDSCTTFPLLSYADTIYATITYQFTNESTCGPPLIVLTGNDKWEVLAWRHERGEDSIIFQTVRYGKNLFLALLGFPGYELSPCQVPSGYCIGDTCDRCKKSWSCNDYPDPFTPNSDVINDYVQFIFHYLRFRPAQIHIFDIHGHEIRTIDVPAGLSAKQRARWDGTDDGGNPVPEGVYIYTIEVAGEVVCEGTVTVAR